MENKSEYIRYYILKYKISQQKIVNIFTVLLILEIFYDTIIA